MAIVSLAAGTPRRCGFGLNKRLLRILILVALLLAGAAVLLASSDGAKRLLLSSDDRDPPAARDNDDHDHHQRLFTSTSRFSPLNVDDDASDRHRCDSFPRYMLNVVQPVLKMGHSENRDRLAAHFETTSSCFTPDELLVVSDLDEQVHGHAAVDVLADLPAGYYDLFKNRDFQHYMDQRDARRNGTLDDGEARTLIDGWILDKYKFLPMVERAWLARPGRAFYFFYEPDTYVFWDNVFRFLQHFDPDTPIYMGSPSPGQRDEVRGVETWFANGGPGFVLSRAAVKALLHRRADPAGRYLDPALTDKWQDLVARECCGDSVLGWALWNITVHLQGYWPMFNPHPLHGIPFSDPYWCQPVLTLHKTSPQDMHSLWRWEFSHRTLHRPILYADLWRLQHPGEPNLLQDWDNGDWDRWDPPAGLAIDSPEACEQYCRRHEKCMQWTWRGGHEKRCIPMSSVRYGTPRKPEYMDDGERRHAIPQEALGKDPGRPWVDYRSGWVESRIRAWRDENKCEDVHWIGPSVSRVF